MEAYRTELVPSRTHPGWTLSVAHHSDADAGPPWENMDTLGAVRSNRIGHWHSHRHGTGKAPGERALDCTDGTVLLYDWAGAVAKGRREGLTGPRAVECATAEFECLRRWCCGSWHYLGLVVSIESAPEGVAFDDSDSDSLWGIESDSESYVCETAQDMGDALIRAQMECNAEAEVAEAERQAVVARTKASIKPVTVQELGVYLEVPDSAVVRTDGWVQAWVMVPAGGAA